MFNLQGKDSDKYFKEDKNRRDQLLIGIETKSRGCSCLQKIENLVFQNTIPNIRQKIINDGLRMDAFI
jgi:hypothetical protein